MKSGTKETNKKESLQIKIIIIISYFQNRTNFFFVSRTVLVNVHNACKTLKVL